jgi:antitoxin HicB
MSQNQHWGSSLNDFLKEEGVHDEVTAVAIKRVIAWQIQEEMKLKGLTKQAMAKLMQTSRAQIDRLLDPNNSGVTLDTLQRAAKVVGRSLRLELV